MLDAELLKALAKLDKEDSGHGDPYAKIILYADASGHIEVGNIIIPNSSFDHLGELVTYLEMLRDDQL